MEENQGQRETAEYGMTRRIALRRSHWGGKGSSTKKARTEIAAEIAEEKTVEQ
jgi:hypothetical protein